ncbi:MAG: 2-oxo acid dehydrogenase subunit E2, partial [Anaerolineae bacterium]|nr:2-oxo acid dehydrogenase subunit E2 [Anaerolineae bacterium]
MATAVIMPRQGNSVESCLIAAWKKTKGDTVAAGDIICEIETDKAMMEVEAPASGTLLDLFFQVGEEVPVLTTIAVIGQPEEDSASFRPNGNNGQPESPAVSSSQTHHPTPPAAEAPVTADVPRRVKISPRARRMADNEGIDLAAVQGSGPGGRVMERDVQAMLDAHPSTEPAAKPEPVKAPLPPSTPTSPAADDIEIIPIRGMRKVIAERMLASLQTTAQLTLNSSADARSMQAYRQRLKQSAETLGLQSVTMTDLVLFGVSRILRQHPNLNALLNNDTLSLYKNIHLGVAVDTPR